MADNRRFIPDQLLDLGQILEEAKLRWLRPSEICEILRNYQKFLLTPEPPVRPPAGSLFLFDRKVLRYFRKDGHSWRKKRDGRTVKEAHEKLKVGSVDVLHCYYAHGEDNENFQRRSYWMLEEQLEHIVLVHYREVKEGYKQGISQLVQADPDSHPGSRQTSPLPCVEQSPSPSSLVQMSYASSPNTVDWNEQALSSEFDEGDSGEDPGLLSLVQPVPGSVSHNNHFNVDKDTGFWDLSRYRLDSEYSGASSNVGVNSSIWSDVHGLSRDMNIIFPDQKQQFGKLTTAERLSHKLFDTKLDGDGNVQNFVSCRDELVPEARRAAHNYSASQAIVTSMANIENSTQVGALKNDEAGELKKLDSFGRWMDKEIGGDCDESLVASDSGNYWNALDTPTDGDKEVSSLSRHMQLDTVLLGPSLSREQLFSISDFAPEWAYSGVETKVLITGSFLGDKELSKDHKWCCMFGEIEVFAEVLTNTVIRCQAPSHAPGRVPFYVTCSNRLACSEVREFEYREKPSEVALSLASQRALEDELCLQLRLVKMLCSGLDRKWLGCNISGCEKCKVKIDISSLRSVCGSDWGRLEEIISLTEKNCVNLRDALIQYLLKDKVYEWIVCKSHEGDKGLHCWDAEGQGIIHLTAALGYEWAMGPITAAGVNFNFRDARGRTALHWASYYGREETVIALVRLGAAAGAVDDPKPAFPGGQTAADLASSRGHKGIAGYLAEADLTSHLLSLTVKDNIMDNAVATIAAEMALETSVQNTVVHGAIDGEVSLKGSLAAFRKSAHAAALIQAAFRVRSFHQRQLTRSSDDVSEVSMDLVAVGSLNKVQKLSHFEDYLHSAAMRIQQKYRGWKGRKEFLKIRSRIVKIQAHVRGHQVRKQYKKVVWSVSIVEKAILRWRRKKPGLRGFRMEKTNEAPGTEKNDEYDFLRIGRKQKFAGVEKALARVHSMVRSPEAREQYMRLQRKFENSKQ